MLSPEGEEEEFDFYLKFAKPLILNLPDTNDRIKAATWIKYLKNDTTAAPALRGNYLKLLLFVLQRRKLFGPFATIPDESKPLEEFPDDINLQDVAKNFVEIDKNILKITLERGGFVQWPPYTVVCSSDLSEYACSQEIPNFGIHAYYAISKEPLNVWNNYDKAIFPMGESIDTSNPKFSVVDSASPDISCFVPSNQVEPAPPSTPRTSPRIPPGGFKPTAKELSDVTPSSLKNKTIHIADDFHMDPRIPPNWGSNLVNVKDSPQLPHRKKIQEDNGDATEKDLLDFFNEDTDGEIQSTQPSSSSVEPSASPPKFTSTPYPAPASPPPPPPPQQYGKTGCGNCNAMKKPQKPSPKSSPNRRPLTTNNLFDALEYIETDKNMSDYYNESFKEQPQNTSPSSSRKVVNTSNVSETSVSSCCKRMEPSEDVAYAVQEILEEMDQPSMGLLQTAGNLIEKTILSRRPETAHKPSQDIFHTPTPYSPRRANCCDRSSQGTPSPRQSVEDLREPVWASTAQFMKYKKGMQPTPPCPFEMRKPPKVDICNDKEGPMWTSSAQYESYKPKCSPSAKKEKKNSSRQNYDIIEEEYDSISQDLGSDFLVERTKFPGPQYVVDTTSEVFEVVDYISKYVEDDLRVHKANIPATTPQRSQSPKRLHAGLEVDPPKPPRKLSNKMAIMNVYNRMYKLIL